MTNPFVLLAVWVFASWLVLAFFRGAHRLSGTDPVVRPINAPKRSEALSRRAASRVYAIPCRDPKGNTSDK